MTYVLCFNISYKSRGVKRHTLKVNSIRSILEGQKSSLIAFFKLLEQLQAGLPSYLYSASDELSKRSIKCGSTFKQQGNHRTHSIGPLFSKPPKPQQHSSTCGSLTFRPYPSSATNLINLTLQGHPNPTLHVYILGC